MTSTMRESGAVRQKLSGRSPRPWVKLWKEERGSFAQLPFLTRAVASELLKFLDDDGRIFVGAKHPADAIAFVAGATRGDRRVMRAAVDDLVTHGYLRVVDGWCEAAGYSLWQYGEATTTVHEAGTTEQRTDHDGATTEHEAVTTAERPCNEEEPKCAESLSPPRQEERREREEQEGEETPERPRVTDRTMRGLGLAISMRSAADLVAAWATAYGEAYRANMNAVWLAASAVQRIVEGNPQRTHQDTAQHLDALAGWLAEVPEVDREKTIATILAGAWADPWMRERSCPLPLLAKTPARWLAPTKPLASTGPVAPSPASAFRVMSVEERRRRMTGGAA